MNNLTEIEVDWNRITGELKLKFPILTDDDLFLDDDLIIMEGKHMEMMRRLQTKLGKTKEEIYEIIIAL